MGDINWLSIALSAIIPMVMGFIWYHKALFGTMWMKETGITEEKAKEANMAVTFGVSLLLSAMLSFFLLNFNNSPGQEGPFDTFGHGAAHGLIVGLFIVVPVFITNGLFEQLSWKRMLINVFYWLVTIAIMGGIMDAMNHWPNELPG
jgi:hypothetical protein